MSDELVDIGPNEDELRLQEEVAKAKALEASEQQEEDDKIRLAQSLAEFERSNPNVKTDGRIFDLEDIPTGPTLEAMSEDEARRFEEETRLQEANKNSLMLLGLLKDLQSRHTGWKFIDRAFKYAYYWGNRADKPFWAVTHSTRMD